MLNLIAHIRNLLHNFQPVCVMQHKRLFLTGDFLISVNGCEKHVTDAQIWGDVSLFDLG